jgi:hypothetical protein
VVEMPGQETGPNATVMNEAIKVVTRDSAIKFDIEHRVRAVYGRQLGIVGANGGYTYVALFYRNDRLYQIEGSASSPTGFFGQHSMPRHRATKAAGGIGALVHSALIPAPLIIGHHFSISAF